MNKILISVLFASVFGLANAATEIATPAAFKSAMETNPAGDYVLTADLDLTDAGYASVASFSGSLDGAGHVIRGLGAQALFVACSGAVTNVTIDGTVGDANTERTQTGCGVFADMATGATFAGCVVKGYTLKHATANQTSVGNGLIVGTANAGCSFERCLAEAGCVLEQDGFGANNQGGIVGIMLFKTGGGVQGRFSCCTNRAQVATSKILGSGNTTAGLGGIVGLVKRLSSDSEIAEVAFSGCVNEADILVVNDTSGTSMAGGIAGHLSGYYNTAFLCASFDGCINRGNLANARYASSVGGIAGMAEERTYVRFDSCVNRGTVGGVRVNHVGGMLGQLKRAPGTDTLVVANCANYGPVVANKALGGLIGLADGVKLSGGAFSIVNSANYGNLTVDSGQHPAVGEWIGKVSNDNSLTGTVELDNCWRKGENDACGSVGVTYAVTTTHEQTAATTAATAVEELNAVARTEADYVQWAVGGDGCPELYVEGALGPEPKPVAALSEATAALARNGQSVTCSVEVASVTVEGGVLRLVVNGKTEKSWTLAAGKSEHVMAVTLGKTYAYSFVAEEATPNPYTTVTVDGTPFTAIGEADWFDVKFTDAGYVPGTTWMTDSTDRSGGTWSGVAGETELDADTRFVTFVKTPTAPAYYAPKSASETCAGVTIKGKMLVDESASVPPADVPFALGFELDTTSLMLRPIVYANGVKTAFGTASLAWRSMADFTIEGKPLTDDCQTWQLQATIGTMVSDALTVTVSKQKVSSLGFSDGTFGDLCGVNRLISGKRGFVMILR